MKKFIVNSISELDNIVNILIKNYSDVKIWAFYGDLGSGKTTLIKKIIEKLSGFKNTCSPSFTIINEYEFNGNIFYHIDLYRIKNENELIEIGFPEYLDKNEYCFIEWPEIAENYLKNYNYLKIHINLEDNCKRIITF
ncbi:MAG: tRNA (adenosine(37)-N6)-threonylcarbamoyltransferase complex ATPase subunit type 1 TsaE [Bacteroidales bacterium]|nr:tRNA (adenosine(37)-N6)-threonylcarbamoyltransferase complex ATPase subunit type 1 TsaE [Bacteroidales bacterium]